MSVVEYRVRSAVASTGALARLDSFAATSVRRSSDPAIGGFRFVPAKGAKRGLALRRTVRIFARPLPLLLVGIVALAILARPESEPHAALSNNSDTLERLAYGWAALSSQARLGMAMSDQPAVIQELDTAAQLELAALSEPAVGASPITTSALPPMTGASIKELPTNPVPLGALPRDSKTLADAPPKLMRLAAVTPIDAALVDVPPTLDAPEDPSGAPPLADSKDEAMGGAEAQPERALTTPRATRARAHRGRSRGNSASKKKQRAPRWAKQMFDNPWQSSAFSYVR
jgi:hypothetical protein